MGHSLKNGYALTTSQVADLLGVSPRTACDMYDRGELEGYRIRGEAGRDGDRRITRRSVHDWLVKNGARVSRALMDRVTPRVLAVTPDHQLARLLFTPPGGDEPGTSVTHALDPYYAACDLFGDAFDLIVLDADSGRNACLGLVRHVKHRRLPTRVVGVLLEDDGLDGEWRDAGTDLCVRLPLPLDAVLALARKKDRSKEQTRQDECSMRSRRAHRSRLAREGEDV